MLDSKIPKLKARLQKIYDLLDPNLPLWDIGCDHGLLGRRGIYDMKFSSLHFVEPSRLAMNSLKENFKDLDSSNGFEFIESLGENLDWSKVTGNVVIAGMGARSIVKILEVALAVNPKSSRHFVLSPQWSVPILTDFLNEKGLVDFTEFSVKEGSRTRVIFSVKQN